jgi:hypothetical protein
MADDPRQEIRGLIGRINQGWLTGRFDDLATLFDPDMVIAGPDLRPVARGREACVESYRGFASQAVIQDFREADHDVVVFGGVAVATYAFDIRYSMAGKTQRATGRDSFVFAEAGSGWRAIWRTIGVTVEKED